VKLHALATVRNEADVIDVTVRFHLARGVDRFLVVDNGSTDGTVRRLARLARRDPRVRWTRDENPFRPAEMHTALAHEAARQGADWVMYVDADEFWTPVATGSSLPDVLGGVRAGGVVVELVTFVQHRRRRRRRRGALRSMDHRVAAPVGPPEECERLVTSGEIAYVEMRYPPKVIVRASETVTFAAGGHGATGVVPDEFVPTGDVVCLHAPLRAREVLDAKADNGRRADVAGREAGEAWHLRRWHRLAQTPGALDREWAANSHAQGSLQLGGVAHPLVRDTRLRDAVTPLLGVHRLIPAGLAQKRRC
jgi:Glycosyl transferase family 2